MLKVGHDSPIYTFHCIVSDYASPFDTIVLLRVVQFDVTVSTSRRQLWPSREAETNVQLAVDSTQLALFDAIVICITIECHRIAKAVDLDLEHQSLGFGLEHRLLFLELASCASIPAIELSKQRCDFPFHTGLATNT